MIKVTNGRVTYTVTKGAFESIYESQGFKIVKAPKVENPSQPETGQEDEKEPTTEDEEFVATMYETPVSKWTKADTLRFADLNGVDISGEKNVDDAKALLRKELEF